MGETSPDREAWLSRRLILGRSLGTAILLTGASAGSADARERAAKHAPNTTRPNATPLPLVVIDAGHGGKDPGAIGIAGGFEKHVTMATALELRRQLLARGRCRVVLTRDRDVFIPLAERITLAERHEAALFVSLHADAVGDHNVRGASVYTLSTTASDSMAAALAARENAADRFGSTHLDAPPEVAAILGGLAQREARLGSVRLQRQVVGAMAGVRDMLEQPARHAGFAVLRSSSVPSVLVEMGFMSNRADEAALKSPRYQARLASALTRAVEGCAAAPGAAMRGA